MKAINDYIVVDQVKEGPKKVGGLLMTDATDSDNRYKKAKVVSVGNLADIIKEGSMVMYDKHAGHEISFEGSSYKVIKLRDVVLAE